jgi:hypothetical protein
MTEIQMIILIWPEMIAMAITVSLLLCLVLQMTDSK